MEARIFQIQNSNETPFQNVEQFDSSMSTSWLLQVILNGVDARPGQADQANLWLQFEGSMLCRITGRNRGEINAIDEI